MREERSYDQERRERRDWEGERGRQNRPVEKKKKREETVLQPSTKRDSRVAHVVGSGLRQDWSLPGPPRWPLRGVGRGSCSCTLGDPGLTLTRQTVCPRRERGNRRGGEERERGRETKPLAFQIDDCTSSSPCLPGGQAYTHTLTHIHTHTLFQLNNKTEV